MSVFIIQRHECIASLACVNAQTPWNQHWCGLCWDRGRMKVSKLRAVLICYSWAKADYVCLKFELSNYGIFKRVIFSCWWAVHPKLCMRAYVFFFHANSGLSHFIRHKLLPFMVWYCYCYRFVPVYCQESCTEMSVVPSQWNIREEKKYWKIRSLHTK